MPHLTNVRVWNRTTRITGNYIIWNFHVQILCIRYELIRLRMTSHVTSSTQGSVSLPGTSEIRRESMQVQNCAYVVPGYHSLLARGSGESVRKGTRLAQFQHNVMSPAT